jgi:serine/threonine-protein phosphatase PGAM5
MKGRSETLNRRYRRRTVGTRVLYLVRHGQYVTDEEHRHHGKLTALGRRQALRTARRLASMCFEVLYHSDLPRAVETAQIMADALSTPRRHTVRALRELMPPLPRRRGAEPRSRAELAEVRVATASLTRRFLRPPKAKQCRAELIVTHGNLIRYLVRLALKEPVLNWVHFGTHHCGVTVIVIRDNAPNYLISYNDIGHLPPSMQSMM